MELGKGWGLVGGQGEGWSLSLVYKHVLTTVAVDGGVVICNYIVGVNWVTLCISSL